MNCFPCKLIPSRNYFYRKRDIGRNQAYAGTFCIIASFDEQWFVVFYPVSDPTGAYGIAVVQLEDDADANALGTNDQQSKPKLALSSLCIQYRKRYSRRARPNDSLLRMAYCHRSAKSLCHHKSQWSQLYEHHPSFFREWRYSRWPPSLVIIAYRFWQMAARSLAL